MFLAKKVLEAFAMTKVLGIVPARAGSKRVPGKNLRVLGGKELVARSLETCLAATAWRQSRCRPTAPRLSQSVRGTLGLSRSAGQIRSRPIKRWRSSMYNTRSNPLRRGANASI